MMLNSTPRADAFGLPLNQEVVVAQHWPMKYCRI
jgi:hypothetical protein